MYRVSRREFLAGAGAGVGALSVGVGAASADRPERYIVGTRSGTATRAAVRSASRVHHVFDFGALGQAVAGAFTAPALRALARRADVRYVEVDVPVHAIAQTLPWGVDRVDAEVAHAAGVTGSGADVAIIDTGIDSDHPDLVDNLGVGTPIVSAKGNYAEPWDDDNGHGTHCAGIADAVNNSQGVAGVATRATLHAVKVLRKNGSGWTSDVVAGINYVVDAGWDVGSLSLGASSGTQTLETACRNAAINGVLLVAAAGNEGGAVNYPAAYDSVVAVSATDRNDQFASFSNRGPEVDLAAPGVNVHSTYAGGGYATLSGTSMACPHVSGAAALLMANGNSAETARQTLTSTAEDVGLASNRQGAGLLDVAGAFGLDSSDDLGGSGGGTDTAPTGSITAVSEADDPSPHATFDVAWSASDADGDLSAVTLTLTDDTTGGTEESASTSASGSSASGTTSLRAHKDETLEHAYTVTLAVSDATGTTVTADSVSFVENGA